MVQIACSVAAEDRAKTGKLLALRLRGDTARSPRCSDTCRRTVIPRQHCMGHNSDDLDLIQKAAAELVARHGISAARMALKHEGQARARGHDTDADAWLAIAGAAAEMLHGKPFVAEVMNFLRRLR
jgi:hypothetical protein